MIRHAALALILVGGAIVAPAGAIEMFTNYNNGTELGTRPLGIEVMSPVRYHAYPHCRWFHAATPRCVEASGFPADGEMAVPFETGGDRATWPASAAASSEIRPEPDQASANSQQGDGDDAWLRAANFLPPAPDPNR